MKYLPLLVFFFLTLVLFSCSENQETTQQADNELTDIVEILLEEYNYNPSATEVKWTAFKHSKKAPVNGKFDSVVVSGFTPSSKLSESLIGVSMELFTASANTNDKARDLKIIASFFGSLLNNASLKATVLSANGDISGDGLLLIDMNGVQKEQAFTWSVDESDELFIKTAINVLDWNGEAALNALNKACEAKHTGPEDAESVLWPDVEVIVLSKLAKIVL